MGKHRPIKLAARKAAQGKSRPAVSRYAEKKMRRLAEEAAKDQDICQPRKVEIR